MNTRILDLIKNPELLQIEDLKLLEKNIEKIPYAQSLRAIYLLGIHQFRQENFKQELTKTATYTTDKKILYYLVNQNQQPKISEEIKKVETPTTIEENQSIEKVEVQKNISETATDTLNKEIKSEPNKGIDFYLKHKDNSIYSEVETKQQSSPKNSMIDFYSTPIKRKEYSQSVSSPISFYEKPISAKKEIQEVEIAEKTDSETNSFNPIEEISEKPQIYDNQEEIQDYQWQPMEVEHISPIPQTETEKTEEYTEKIIEIENNFSEKVEKEIEIQSTAKETTAETSSNIPQFINTWQNWLKATPPPSNREKNFAIIDKFIENNPKISPVSEEVEFNFKEKDDDISHLMTETLAQLYLEQKLYSKAINAYQILQEKHPERSEDFEEMIDEIKKMRKIN